MRLLIRFLAVLAVANVLGIAQAQTGAKVEPYGLQGLRITCLAIYNLSLYAGTDNNGVFRRIVTEADSGWVFLGLRGKRVRSIYPHQVGPIGFGITAGLGQQPAIGDTTLTFCTNMSETNWFATDTGMDRSAVHAIVTVDGFPTLAICGETFAAGGGQIYRKVDVVWDKVFDMDGGSINAIRAPVYRRDSLRGLVWAGGESPSRTAFIARSLDKGITWEITYPDRSGPNSCLSLAAHAEKADVVYAGLHGSVVMTTDQGATWFPTALQNPDIAFTAIAVDPLEPGHLYAGGIAAAGEAFALFETPDGGTSWERISGPPNLPGISAVTADPIIRGRAYVSTLGDGVYRVTSALVPVHDLPISSVLTITPVHPNPTSAAGASDPRLDISGIPATTVRVVVTDALGIEVARLPDASIPSGGTLSVALPLRGRSPGVYFCRIVSPRSVRVTKLVLVR